MVKKICSRQQKDIVSRAADWIDVILPSFLHHVSVFGCAVTVCYLPSHWWAWLFNSIWACLCVCRLRGSLSDLTHNGSCQTIVGTKLWHHGGLMYCKADYNIHRSCVRFDKDVSLRHAAKHNALIMWSDTRCHFNPFEIAKSGMENMISGRQVFLRQSCSQVGNRNEKLGFWFFFNLSTQSNISPGRILQINA